MPAEVGDEMRSNFSCRPWALTLWVFLLNVPMFGQSAGFWSGQAQCLLIVQAQGFAHNEIQTWALTGGAPTQQGAMQIYPTTWSVTGEGGAQQPNFVAQWSKNVRGMSAPRVLFGRAPDNWLIIKPWHAQLVAHGATSGVKQVGGTQTSIPGAAS